MTDMEFVSEAVENIEQINEAELNEQREILQARIEEAKASGNIESANFYMGKLTNLEQEFEKIKPVDTAKSEEIKLGYSSDYYERKAAEALADGDKRRYELNKKYWAEKKGRRRYERMNDSRSKAIQTGCNERGKT